MTKRRRRSREAVAVESALKTRINVRGAPASLPAISSGSWKMTTPRKYRDWLRVLEEILTIALEGATVSRIVYGANITFPRFHTYALFLLERGLLVREQSPEGTIYKTTEKGRNFLTYMRKARELLAVPPRIAASP